MDELIQAMSVPELRQFKTQFKDKPSIGTIIDGYIATKEKAEAEAKAAEAYDAKVAKLANLPAPPPGYPLYVHLQWEEVETEDTSQAPEEVEVVAEPAVTDKDGNIITPAVMATEQRYPKVKQFQWVNKQQWVAPKQGKSTNGNGGGKRQGTFGYLEPGKPISQLGTFKDGMAVVAYANANMAQFHLSQPIDPEKEGGGNSYRALQAHNIYELNDDGTIRPH